MATEAQINANRENAKKSTGPSPEGKEASSRNRTTHGLRGGYKNSDFFLPADEDPEKFQELYHEWLRGRALRFQHCWFEPRGGFVNHEGLALFMRYEAQHERAFYKAVRELQNLRRQTTDSKIGFERHPLKISAENRAIDTMRMSKQVFEWKKEDREVKKLRVQGASASGNTSEVSPGDPPKGRLTTSNIRRRSRATPRVCLLFINHLEKRQRLGILRP